MNEITADVVPTGPRIIQPVPLPYELRIGVVGHRTIQDTEALTRRLNEAVDRVDKVLHADTGPPVEWTILTPAARGADRVIANTIKARKPNAKLRVVCPFRIDEYRKDFDSPDDLDTFNTMVEQADNLFELNPAPEFPANIEQRKLAYLDAGRTIVNTSEILIVLWNGLPAAGLGGTGDAVRYAVEVGQMVIWIDDAHADRPPRRLVRAAGGEEPICTIDGIDIASTKLPDTVEDLSPASAALRAFTVRNSDHADYDLAYAKEAGELCACAAKAGLMPDDLRGVLEKLLPYKVHASVRADHFRKLYRRASYAVFGLAAATVLISITQVTVFPGYNWISGLEVIAMATAFVIYHVNESKDWHGKWRQSRYIAEQLRIAKFTAIAGSDQHDTESVNPLPFYIGPQSWLPAMVQRIVRAAGRVTPATADFESIKQFVIAGWLAHQQRWHAKNAKFHEDRTRPNKTFVKLAFLITMAAAFCQMLAIGVGDNGPKNDVIDLTREYGVLFVILGIGLPACVAVAIGISKQFEEERVAIRSGQMSSVYQRQVESARKAATPEQLRSELRSTADTAMLENYEWWVMLSFNPPELVL